MTNPQKQTKSFNVNCWLDVRTLASLVLWLEKEEGGVVSTSYSQVVHICLEVLAKLLASNSQRKLNYITSTDQAIQELKARGFSTKQLRSPSKLGKQLVLEDQEQNENPKHPIYSSISWSGVLGKPVASQGDSTPPEGASLPSDDLERALTESSKHWAQNEPKEREDSKDEPTE